VEALPLGVMVAQSGSSWLSMVSGALGEALSWALAATPAWLALCLLAACVVLFVQQRAIIRRLDSHAESIANMDSWADDVDAALTSLEERSKRLTPAYLPVKSPQVAVKRWWKK
jgi:hypothetical protein